MPKKAKKKPKGTSRKPKKAPKQKLRRLKKKTVERIQPLYLPECVVLFFPRRSGMNQQLRDDNERWTSEDQTVHEVQEQQLQDLRSALQEARQIMAAVNQKDEELRADLQTIKTQLRTVEEENRERGQKGEERAQRRATNRAKRLALLKEAQEDAKSLRALIAQINARLNGTPVPPSVATPPAVAQATPASTTNLVPSTVTTK